MTQDNKIWRDYDINNMPDPRREILAYNGKHHNVTIIDREDWEQGFCEWIKHWAYLDDLLTISKALDVARDMYLKKCEECGIWACPDESNADKIDKNKEIYRKAGKKEFDKAINEIMKS